MLWRESATGDLAYLGWRQFSKGLNKLPGRQWHCFLINVCVLSHFSSVQFSSVAQSCLTLRPHELQHTRPPCPSPTPEVHPNSCPSRWWCHPTISSCFPLLLLPSIFTSIGVFSNESAIRIRWPKYWSFSLNISPPMNTQDWSPLGWTGWISLQSKALSRVFFSTTVQKHQFFGAQLSL